MALYLPVIMLQKQKKTPVKASSRQDSKRPICGLEQLQEGRTCLARLPLTLARHDKPLELDLLSEQSLAQDIISLPWTQRTAKSKRGDKKM